MQADQDDKKPDQEQEESVFTEGDDHSSSSSSSAKPSNDNEKVKPGKHESPSDSGEEEEKKEYKSDSSSLVEDSNLKEKTREEENDDNSSKRARDGGKITVDTDERLSEEDGEGAEEEDGRGSLGEADSEDESNLENNNQHHTESSRAEAPVFEELGVPFLLYRNHNEEDALLLETQPGGNAPWAARQQHTGPELQAKFIHSNTMALRRSQARWYYPMDYPVVQAALVEQPNQKRRKRRTDPGSTSDKKSTHNQLDPFRNEQADSARGFFESRVFGLVDSARQTMLDTADHPDDNDVYCMHNQPFATPDYTWEDMVRSKSFKRRKLLQAYRKSDCTYIPATWKHQRGRNSKEPPKLHLNQSRQNDSKFFAQQRLDLADPAYLAPFPLQSLVQSLQEDDGDDDGDAYGSPNSDNDKHRNTRPDSLRKSRQRQKQHPQPNDDDGAVFGNCIACAPCTCPGCTSHEKGPNWFLLHPVGELLETIVASTLKTRYGLADNAILRTQENMKQQKKVAKRPSYNQIDVGDSVRQIEQCGGQTGSVFFARTTIHVTVFSVLPCQDDSLADERRRQKRNATSSTKKLCWGTFQLTKLQRIDLRSFNRHSSSYFPLHVASYTTFSGSFLTGYQCKVVVLSSDSTKGIECNTLHHFLLPIPPDKKNYSTESLPQPHCTKHIIRNLRSISQVVFSNRHPMVLWASALSFVRPAPTADHASRSSNIQPRAGHGSALYEIDLRTSEATYRWSPSAEDFLVETVHSISCIAVNSRNDGSSRKDTLWVSSISAGKMYELDPSFTVLRVVNSWSLAGLCDGFGVALPHLDSGALIVKAAVSKTTACPGSDWSLHQLPFVSIRASATTGIQMFQSASEKPPFQADNLETAISCALTPAQRKYVCMSSFITLPKFPPNKVACGLASVMLPLSSFVAEGDRVRAGIPSDACDHINCLITMVSSGDIQAHILLGSSDGIWNNSELPGGIPLGIGAGVSKLATSIATVANNGPEYKLAGGMGLHLGVHVDMNQERKWPSTERWGGSEQRSVRPFKYSDLQRLSAGERHDPEGNADDSYIIRRLRNLHDSLPAPLTRESQRGMGCPDVRLGQVDIETSVEAFQAIMTGERNPLDSSGAVTENVDRSDVTNQLLDKVKQQWDKHGESDGG